jgi:hypothetical protein
MTVYNFRAPALPLPAANYDRDQQDQFQSALRLYFSRLDNYNAAASLIPNGTTADRPTQRLQTGQYYFDTTLGIPIWYNGTAWINASGTVI